MNVTEDHQIVRTADGSDSVRSSRFAVDYHSTHGALQESRHVFIAAGLQPLLSSGVEQINILEMGFGTGLNALLVRQEAMRFPTTDFRYHTLERYPLTAASVARLNYTELLGLPHDRLMDLHQAAWDAPVPLDANFTLDKRKADFLEGCPFWTTGVMDLIFYDAFAPSSQPELWTPAAISISFAALRPGGVFVTYCAKGQFKRDLKAAGFIVEPLPGPPGKREMTRARKPG